MKKAQKPGYLALGAVLIGVVAILIVYLVMIATGLIQISRQHITIVTESASKLYDGEALTADGWEMTGGKLLDGHTVEATVTGSQTEVGVSDNYVTIYIYDSEGADVTDKYIVECHLGKLAVNGQRLEIVSGSAQKYYDGTPLTCQDWSIVNGSLGAGHECNVTITGIATTVGVFPNTMAVRIIDKESGEDVTSHYTMTVTEGTLQIVGIRLVISGDFNINNGVVDMKNILVSGELLPGHTLKCDPIDQNIGGIDINAVHAYVVDKNGKDVTEYYDIIYGTDLPDIDLPLDSITGGGGFGGGGFGGGNAMGAGPGSDAPSYLCFEVLATKSGSLYMRAQSYGDFDGDNWGEAYGRTDVGPFTFAVDALKANGVYKNDTLKVKMLLSELPYMLPYYANEFAADHISDTLVEWGYSVGEAYTVQFSYYEYLSSHNYKVSSQLQTLEREFSQIYTSGYMNVAPQTKQQLLDLAAKAGINANSENIVEQVQKYIMNAASYDLDCGEAPVGVDKVIYFLTTSKVGVCRHFATAATLMYRSLGIPARYVEGFYVEAEKDAWTQVESDRAHAWVEVYIDGMGWIAVEVTPPVSGGSGSIPGGGGDGNNNGNPGGGDTQRKFSVYINTASAWKDYDGTPLTNSAVDWSSFGTANQYWTKKSGTDMWVCSGTGQEGHYFYESEAVVTGSQLYAGSSGNFINLTVYDKDGNIVTSNYRVYVSGKLEVKPITLTITSGSATGDVDKGAWSEKYFVDFDGGRALLEGHSISVEFDITAKEPFTHRGEEQNTFTACILDKDGKDVTSLYYKINKAYGKLTVE